MSESDLSIGEKVHLTQRYIKGIFKKTNTILGISILLVFVIVLIGIPSVYFMQSFGHYEDRLNSAQGPPCIPSSYSDPNNAPAQILIIEGQGAEKAGLKDGDVIRRINDVEFPNNVSLRGWAEKFPNLQPGDFIDVDVFRYGSELSFTVQTTPREDDPSKPLMGIIVPENPTCFSYFVLNEGMKFTESEMDLVIIALWFVISITVAIGVVLIVSFVFKIRPEIKELKEDLADIENDYLDENYVLTLSTTKPKGTTNGEKILNMMQTIFPELRKDYYHVTKWGGTMKLTDGYEFDCFQTTWDKAPTVFIAKHFGDETITLPKLQELCDEANKSIKDKNVEIEINDIYLTEIMRLVCVGRNYDPKFFESDQKLQEIMNELKFDGLIDLIQEKDDGTYSLIWIDYE